MEPEGASMSQALRILFLTLEFRAGTFSGNGVYAIAQLPVSSWHRLDAGAPWREYAAGALSDDVAEAVRAFAPQLVLAVDWSSLPAARNLRPACRGAPLVFLNYRVFSRTAAGEDLELVSGFESAAMEESILTVALSRSDAEYLVSHVSRKGSQAAATLPKVLLPALREDVRQLRPPAELLRLAEALRGAPLAGAEGQQGECAAAKAEAVAAMAARSYLSCVVRLSPEKEPERFVDVVEAMAAKGLLEQHSLTPLLLGAANDEYAQALKARLRAAAPQSVILERFVGPSELADLYRQTRLNFHPSTYDAYGMTVVEAASQGAPSIVHDGNGAVGATDLLRSAAGEVFLLDLKAPPEQTAAALGALLSQPGRLADTAARAMLRARSWDESANAAELVRLVRGAVEAGRACPAQGLDGADTTNQ
ncbi:hypothetical protein GPECTOR_1g172 [Gonium pectorale]|uniref:Glycosyl transferase family 1 domain-containing protein n=1 Tax=Gonium pectorale TaxID=33097 RepID=A0A150H231_GONPE|nr:hypothetical protein GPECTOR_1g172 [Gonium pectorale]|eukprot:KXZ56199.1 hypothetical protein GPECTOR_1g172 [Gonium pectorale]